MIPYLEQHDIYSRGRFGMWKYEVANTDHTLMQGVELVNRLLLGEPEQTIGIKYESTLDGRNAAKHERSTLAGSGDPKKMKELAELTGKAPAVAHPGTVDGQGNVKAIPTAQHRRHVGFAQRRRPRRQGRGPHVGRRARRHHAARHEGGRPMTSQPRPRHPGQDDRRGSKKSQRKTDPDKR